MKIEYREVPLQKIDFSDQAFSFSFPSRASFLLDSIKQIGIINPPLLRQKEGKYQIICGFGRLLVARELNLFSLPCQVVFSLEDIQALRISLEDNICSRGLNIIEKALVIAKFSSYLSTSQIIQEILPRLGFKPSFKNLEFLRNLSLLEEETKRLVLEEIISPQIAAKLADLSQKDRCSIRELIFLIRPSVSRQRQFLEMLEDLSRKKDLPIHEILKAPEILKILKDPKLNFKQKSERLFSFLKKKVQPRLSQREAAFRKWASQIEEKDIRLRPSPNFERDLYTIEISFKDLKDLQEKCQRVFNKSKELLLKKPSPDFFL